MKVIAFEGIDASGKETQARMLVSSLRKSGFRVAKESFPRYDLPVGGLIRQALNGNIDITPVALHALLDVDKHDFLTEALQLRDSGYDFLVLDRWTMSNYAFAVGKGLPPWFIISWQRGLFSPDITFILDITVEESFKRRPEREDSHEKNEELLRSVREEYLLLAEDSVAIDSLVQVIDAEQDVESIHEEVMAHVQLSFLTPTEQAYQDVEDDSIEVTFIQ